MILLIVLSPNLKTSSMKTTQLLQDIGARFETLLLNLPIEMEKELIELSSGSMSTDDFIDEAKRRRLIPKPIGAWEYSERPMLEALPKIARLFPGLSARCYGNSEQEFASIGVAVEIAKLTLRTTLRNYVKIGEWRETLLHSLDVDKETRKAHVGAITERAGRTSICLSDMGGRGLRESLMRSGFHVKIHYVERPYHFTPLMILERLMARGFVTDREIERLVRCHLEYIRGYVYKFDNRDRAYYEWVYDKIHWLRERIDKEEIEALDSIINGS